MNEKRKKAWELVKTESDKVAKEIGVSTDDVKLTKRELEWVDGCELKNNKHISGQ